MRHILEYKESLYRNLVKWYSMYLYKPYQSRQVWFFHIYWSSEEICREFPISWVCSESRQSQLSLQQVMLEAQQLWWCPMSLTEWFQWKPGIGQPQPLYEMWGIHNDKDLEHSLVGWYYHFRRMHHHSFLSHPLESTTAIFSPQSTQNGLWSWCTHTKLTNMHG